MALVVTPVIPPNPPPAMSTRGISLDSTGAIWLQGPKGAITQIGQKGDTGGLTMGTAQAIASGAAIPVGDWVFVPSAGQASLIHSDGTATAPSAGNIYQLTQH